MEKVLRTYKSFEASPKGKVGEKALENLSICLTKREREFEALLPSLYKVQGEASKYIQTSSTNAQEVTDSFTKIKKEPHQILRDLENTDQIVKGHMGELSCLLREATGLFRQIMDCVYGGEGPSKKSLESFRRLHGYQTAIQSLHTKHLLAIAKKDLEKSSFSILSLFQRSGVWYPSFGGVYVFGRVLEEKESYWKKKKGMLETGDINAKVHEFGKYHSEYFDAKFNYLQEYQNRKSRFGWSRNFLGFDNEWELGDEKAERSAVLHYKDFIALKGKANHKKNVISIKNDFHLLDPNGYIGYDQRVSYTSTEDSVSGDLSVFGLKIMKGKMSAKGPSYDIENVNKLYMNGESEQFLGAGVTAGEAKISGSIGLGKYTYTDPKTGEKTEKKF